MSKIGKYPVGVTRQKPSNYEAVEAWYMDSRGVVELTPVQEAYRQRLTEAFALMQKKHSINKVALIHSKVHGITDRTAYTDIRDAIRLFGNIQKADKEGMRYIVYDLAMKTYSKANKAGDFRSATAALNVAAKVMALDREDPDIPDFEKLQPNNYQINIPAQLENKLMELLSTGSLNLSRMPETFQEAEIVEETIEQDER